MTPEVDMETLRLLVAIDDHGSIGAAAREIGVSQPAASARLREFEARWRLAAVARSARGSTLTEDGRAIVFWARRVLAEVEVMRAGMAALSGERRAGLSIAASLTVAEFLLPRWIGELRGRLPEIQPHLQVVNSEAVTALVRRGEVDLGFIETAAIPTDLVSRVVGRDRLVVVVPPDHPWARRSMPVPVEVLREAHYVLREPGSGTRSTFEAALRGIPKVAMEASSTTTLVGGARAGVGPAVVSRRAVAHEIEMGRLRVVEHELGLLRPLTAIWRPSAGPRALPEAAGELLRIAARTPEHS